MSSLEDCGRAAWDAYAGPGRLLEWHELSDYERGIWRGVAQAVVDTAAPGGGHALPRDTWPSQAVLAVCPGKTAEQVERERKVERER
jgi:hypothetical protein